jgi:hypothetical protein
MLVFSLTEQVTQKTKQEGAKLRKKRRTREQKIGRLKYNQWLLKRVLTEIKETRNIMRIILNGLKGAGYFHFDVPLIQKVACVDVVDVLILERIHEVGTQGSFPKDVARDLGKYGLQYYHVSRRIRRMNKRLEHEIGERLFEKRGLKWALTPFAFDVWGETEKRDENGMEDVSEEEKPKSRGR